MVTYIIGTDGVPASEAICAYLETEAGPEDHLEVLNVLPSDDIEDIDAGKEALAAFEDCFGDDVSLSTTQVSRGRGPADELVSQAQEVDADHVVTALRRHSRTERIIFGSVSHSLLQRVTRPITLVPLEDYQPADA